MTGHEFYGKTLIGHMNDIGALGRRTTIAHSVWVTDEDIGMIEYEKNVMESKKYDGTNKM